MERSEYVAWCKGRALKYLDRGDIAEAITSMMSDMSKRDDTKGVIDGPVGTLGMMYVMQRDASGARRWIEGFNWMAALSSDPQPLGSAREATEGNPVEDEPRTGGRHGRDSQGGER